MTEQCDTVLKFFDDILDDDLCEKSPDHNHCWHVIKRQHIGSTVTTIYVCCWCGKQKTEELYVDGSQTWTHDENKHGPYCKTQAYY